MTSHTAFLQSPLCLATSDAALPRAANIGNSLGIALDFAHQPPRMCEAPIARVALSTRLQAAKSQVTLLIGPPGSGKTTALALHNDALIVQVQNSRWLNLAPSHNDPQLLIQALHTAFCAPHPLVKGEMPCIPEGISAFIDGLDVLSAPAAREILERFFDTLPARSQLYASARQWNSPWLQDARLRGLVQILNRADMRMSDAEASELLGAQWTPSDVQRLNRFLDGWAAGLRFVARSPQEARCWLDDPRRPLSLEMSDYFETVLCAGLDDDALQVLMALSVLERFTPELLASLCSPPCDWVHVEQLVRSGRFLCHPEGSLDWVQFHPAFGEYLRQRMRREYPQQYDQIQQQAAKWFVQRGLAAEAVRHAVRLRNMPLAARLIEESGAICVDVGEGSGIQLPQAVSPAQAIELPLLFLGQIYHDLRHGRLGPAQQAFDAACSVTENFTRLQEPSHAKLAQIWMRMLAVVFRAAQDLPISLPDISMLEDDLRQQLSTNPVMAASLASVLAYIYVDRCQYQDAAVVCSQGLHAQRADTTNKVVLFIRQHQASAALAIDTLDMAVLCIEDAQRLAAIDGGHDSYEVICTQILRGVLHYENRALEKGWALLAPALAQLRKINGWGYLYVEAYTAAATIAHRRQGLDAAEAVLHAGELFALERKLPRLILFIAIARLRERTRAGAVQSAWALMQSSLISDCLAPYDQARDTDPFHLQPRLHAQLACAELYLALGRPRDARALLANCSVPLLESADSRLRLTHHLLSLRLAQALRRYHTAITHTQAVLDLARQVGLYQRAAEAREYLLQTFDHGTRTGHSWPARTRQWVEDHLRSPLPSELSQSRPQQPRPALFAEGDCTLSPREGEIIALIAEGLLNKEIGARLAITEGTVKSHRKKIYSKLGVSSRSQAIQRARKLLLL